MKRSVLGMLLLFCGLVWPAFVWAEPRMQVSISAEQEVVIREDGLVRIERKPTRDIRPGAELIYTVAYINAGDEAARKVIINNPIPANGSYVANSSIAPGAEVSFSIDGGSSYDTPDRLFDEVETADGDTLTITAAPEQYTHIRWVLEEVGAGESGHASFRVRVKGSPDGAPVLDQAAETAPEPEALPAISPLAEEPETPLAASPLTEEPRMFVQVGAFSIIENAMELRSELAGLFPSAHIASSAWKDRLLYRVRIGPFEDTRQIENTVIELHRRGRDTVIVTE